MTDDPRDELAHYTGAARSVTDAAAGRSVPTAAAARRHQRRRGAVGTGVAATVAVLAVGGAVALRGPATQEVSVGSPVDQGTIGGTTVGTALGNTVGTTVAVPGSSLPVPDPTVTVPTSTPHTTPDTTPATTPDTTPATTTPATTTPPTTTPPTTVEVPDALAAGTYSGIEHYELGSGVCPDLKHHLDATLTTADGTTWTYVADYCGENGADGWWRGEGKLVFTAPDGATLSAPFTSRAPTGQSGGPIVAEVTGGGRLAGATGTCTITVNVEPLRMGEQQQSGTITCTLGAQP